MTPRDLRNTHTTGNSCRDTLPCANMALKLPQYFYLLMEKPLGHYFQVWSPYYQMAKCNQKTPIPKFIISADDIGAQMWFYIQDFHGSKLLRPGSLTKCIPLNFQPLSLIYCISLVKDQSSFYEICRILLG